MTRTAPEKFRATCYSALGSATHKEPFDTEAQAKAWAEKHIKGFGKIVVEKSARGGDKWAIAASFTHR